MYLGLHVTSHGKLTLDNSPFSRCNSSVSTTLPQTYQEAGLSCRFASCICFSIPPHLTDDIWPTKAILKSFIATNEPISCASHNYNTFILSHEPLIIYIENFLTAGESKHLIEIRYLSLPAKCFPFRNFRFLANGFGST